MSVITLQSLTPCIDSSLSRPLLALLTVLPLYYRRTRAFESSRQKSPCSALPQQGKNSWLLLFFFLLLFPCWGRAEQANFWRELFKRVLMTVIKWQDLKWRAGLAIKFSIHNRCLKYLTLQTFPWESFLTCFLAAELLSTLITQSRHSNIKKEAPILIVLVPKSYEWRSVYLTAKVFFPEIRKTCWKCHRGFDVYNIV